MSKTYGQIAYETMKSIVDEQSGLSLPPWESLSEEVERAWDLVAAAVLAEHSQVLLGLSDTVLSRDEER